MVPILAVLIPTGGAGLILLLRRHPNVREAASLLTAASLVLVVASLLPEVPAGIQPPSMRLPLWSGLSIALAVEPLGVLFALVAAVLWLATTVYSIGYLRANHESHQTRYYVFFALALAATMGIAFAANGLTLFIFYELLTLFTYPLVTHSGDTQAKRGGRVYLGILLTTSIGFLLFALIWTWMLAGTLEFTQGGILGAVDHPGLLAVLFALYMFGIGKAALMPFHRWLPAAMVAPTPVSALLHAVAVVKAGVFAVLKVSLYLFGLDHLAQTAIPDLIMWVAAITLLVAPLIALLQDNLKMRLAYSTISQLAYVVLGATLASSAGIIGGVLQIVMHAFAKITLFFCAGAIYTAAHKSNVSELDGLGRAMPFTFGAFFVASLSIIGLPPLGGIWSKWYLMLGAVHAGEPVMVAVLMASSLLSIGYLMSIVARGFFLAPKTPVADIQEAPLACVAPLMLTAIACVALFFFIDPLYALAASLVP